MRDTKRFQTMEELKTYYESIVKFQFIAWFVLTLILCSTLLAFYIPIRLKWNNLDKIGQQHALLYDKWKQAHLATIKDFEEAMTVEEQKYAKFEAVLKTEPTPTK